MSNITHTSSTLPVCHMFIDASNVGVFEANIPGLSAIAHRGFGAVHTAAVVGTTASPSDRATLWSRLGYSANFNVRAPGQPESAYMPPLPPAVLFCDILFKYNVDTTIVCWIYRAMHNYGHQKSTIVFVTGDGNDNHGDPNFREVVQSALQGGWHVKLVCFNPNPVYCTMQRRFPISMQIVRIATPMIAAANANHTDAIVGPPRAHESAALPPRTRSAANPAVPRTPAMTAAAPQPPMPTAQPATPARVQPAAPAAPSASGVVLVGVQRAQEARPNTVVRHRAAAATETWQTAQLLRMIDQALAGGCVSFSACVSAESTSFSAQ